MRFFVVLVGILALAFLNGCVSKPLVETQIIEKPVPVPCRVELPEECKTAYAVDRVSVKDEPLTINRAMRVELEERMICETKLRAALRGCNSTLMVK